MIVHLRTRPGSSAPDDVVTSLLSCHERIRRFVSLALRLSSATDVPAEQVADAAAQLRKYFTVALPLHAADEDQSVKPRLLAARPDPEVTRALHTMSDQHPLIDSAIAGLEPLWHALVQTPARLPELSEELNIRTLHFQNLWNEHLPLEESLVFPAIRQWLPQREQQAILEEMRARRSAKNVLPPDT